MKHTRFLLKIGLVAGAAAVLIAFAAHLLIRKNCCEQLSDDALRELERSANKGSVPAMKRLYVFFDQDGQTAKAETWLRRAADTGDAEAEYDIWGRAVPAEKPSVMNYLVRSAQHGSSFAQFTLGELYRDGVDVPKNIDTARYWLQKSARGGEPAGVLALCDLAAADRDIPQCKECIVLENRAIASLQPKSYYVVQLRQQQKRIEAIVNGADVR